MDAIVTVKLYIIVADRSRLRLCGESNYIDGITCKFHCTLLLLILIW